MLCKKKAQILGFHSSIENLIYNDKLEVEEEKTMIRSDMICELNRTIDRTGIHSIDQIFVKRPTNLRMLRIFIKAFL